MDERTTDVDPMRESLCGRTLGDYRIERRVGGGATSDVFLAKQISLSRPVALKILKDELANDEKYVKRFLQEARAAARLEHPNIVRIYEVGELVDQEKTKVGRKRVTKTYRFIAQEYVGGLSLAQFLRRSGRTTVMQTFAALEQIASALKRAADLNLIHRDVKPENVLIDSNGVLKVVDFGLAHFAGSTETSLATTTLTRTGVALGTPLYMSPEQARGQKLDPRSDIYSLGVTAYLMLTGTPPFHGETPLAVVLKHLNERPRPISELRPETPKALVDLVHSMLEKNPNDRPKSMDELLDRLAEARREYAASQQTEEAPTVEERPIDGSAGSVDFGDSSNAGFFQTDAERDVFQSVLHATNLSSEWQTSVVRLDEKRRESVRFWSRRNILIGGALALAAFLVGGGALLLRNCVVAAQDVEPALTILKQNSVEEQYVFALQVGTVDAWRSVGEYFPEDKYWTSRAKRQLALAYVEEKNVDEAERIFADITSSSGQSLRNDALGTVGSAWVAASRGDYAAAAATLSELNDSRSLDGLSEVVLMRTRALFQNRYGDDSAEVNAFNRFTGVGSEKQPFGMRNDRDGRGPMGNRGR